MGFGLVRLLAPFGKLKHAKCRVSDNFIQQLGFPSQTQTNIDKLSGLEDLDDDAHYYHT